MTTATAKEHWFTKYLVDVPEGRSGPWAVERFEVPEQSIERLRCLMAGRDVPPGIYTRLSHDRRGVIMSDTPSEISDHLTPIRHARGRVLINGLGLGMVLKACLAKPDVQHVDVVEMDADVIALVAPHYQCDRLTIHHADAYAFKPPRGQQWDVVWHDIWDTICSDNLAEMGKLHRKYGRRCVWQGSWARELCESYRRRGY